MDSAPASTPKVYDRRNPSGKLILAWIVAQIPTLGYSLCAVAYNNDAGGLFDAIFWGAQAFVFAYAGAYILKRRRTLMNIGVLCGLCASMTLQWLNEIIVGRGQFIAIIVFAFLAQASVAALLFRHREWIVAIEAIAAPTSATLLNDEEEEDEQENTTLD